MLEKEKCLSAKYLLQFSEDPRDINIAKKSKDASIFNDKV